MRVALHPVSGLGAKEPAAFLAVVGDRRILLDLGAGPDGAVPPLEAAGRVDAVILSHGHPDHAGGVGALRSIGGPPVHATAEVLATLPCSVVGHPLPPRGSATVAGVPVETGRSGHAIGGVWVRIADQLLYMGDHSDASDVLAADEPPPTATVILDCSYGTADETRARQVAAIVDLARAGPVLMPVPPDGRGVEIALALAGAGVAVALCPAVRAALASLGGDGRVWARNDAVADAARRLADAAPPAYAAATGAVLAAGATADRGAAAALLPRWLERGGTVLFTGHLGAGTVGARLVATGDALQLRWNVHPTLAENVALARHLCARRVVPAFCDRRDWPALARHFAPARLSTGDDSADGSVERWTKFLER